MGFLSSFTGLLGGGGSKSSATSGFSLLPGEIQEAWKKFGTEVMPFFPSGQGISMFTPMGMTPDEQKAFSMIRGGFAPTEESIRSDVSMQMNPFDDFVIDEINRQAGGEYSLLKRAMSEAGQFGSNRQMLGASDIDLRRTGQIGQFRQSQFDRAIQNALTTLPGMRQQDALGLMGLGEFERGLDTQTRQAPINNLLALAQILGILPTDGGSQQTTKESGGFDLGGILSGASKIFRL